MNSADMASLVPNPDDLLALPMKEQGKLILRLLSGYDNPQKPIAHTNFFNRANDFAARPKYEGGQKEVDAALMEAWSWLEGQGLLTKSPSSGANWFFVGKTGKAFLQEEQTAGEIDRWEKLGFDRVKHYLEKGDGLREVGATEEIRERAWAWLKRKQEDRHQAPPPPVQKHSLTLIADSRLEELRALRSPEFDFRKLIRVCEELNTAYREECYFATAMLTRSLLDHVPPLFGKKSFDEVASNYGGKSFKGTMQHLQNASRNVADGHLHQQIRKTESLPTAQQVNSAQQLDALLEEIVRITREKGGMS